MTFNTRCYHMFTSVFVAHIHTHMQLLLERTDKVENRVDQCRTGVRRK